MMVSVKRKIVRNTAANTFMKLWRYAVNFFLLPFIILHVGVEDYGLYLLVGAFVGYFGLLDLGVGASLVKYVAEYNAKGDKEMINKMVNSTFVFYLGVGIAVCLGVMAIGYFFVDFFKVEEGSVELARGIAAMVAIGALTSWPIRSFSTSLEGLQRYDMNVLVDFVTVTINAGVTIWLLLSGYGIIELIFSGIVVGAIGQISKVWIVQRMMPFLELRTKYMGLSTMKQIFTFSSVVFAGQIIGLIMLGLDRIVLGLFVGVASITFYYIARNLHDIIETISRLPTSAILPAASEMIAEKKKGRLKALIFRGSKYRIAITLPLTIFILIFAKEILQFWMGSDFIWLAPYVQLFVSYRLLTAMFGLTDIILLAKEKFVPILKINVYNAILNIILSIILTYYFGLIGVIAGTVLAWVLIFPWVMNALLKYNKLSGKRYLRKVIYPTYGPGAVMCAVLIVFHQFTNVNNIYIFITTGIIGLASYIILFYKWSLNSKEKIEMQTLLLKRN